MSVGVTAVTVCGVNMGITYIRPDGADACLELKSRHPSQTQWLHDKAVRTVEAGRCEA